MLQAEQPTVQANDGTPGHLKQEAALKSLRRLRKGQESCGAQDCTLNICYAQVDVLPDGEVMREVGQTCEQKLLQNGERRRGQKKTQQSKTKKNQEQEQREKPQTTQLPIAANTSPKTMGNQCKQWQLTME